MSDQTVTPALTAALPIAPVGFHLPAKSTGTVCNLACCGSGRRWKHCHGPDAPRVPASDGG